MLHVHLCLCSHEALHLHMQGRISLWLRYCKGNCIGFLCIPSQNLLNLSTFALEVVKFVFQFLKFIHFSPSPKKKLWRNSYRNKNFLSTSWYCIGRWKKICLAASCFSCFEASLPLNELPKSSSKLLKLFVLLQAEEQLIEPIEPLKVAVRYLYLLDPKMSHF